MSNADSNKILRAYWKSEHQIEVLLARDWGVRAKPPPLYLGSTAQLVKNLVRSDSVEFGELSGYFKSGKEIVFLITEKHWNAWGLQGHRVYVGGDFNGWGDAVGNDLWLFKPKTINKKKYWVVELDWEHCFKSGKSNAFKFVAENKSWLDVIPEAPNMVVDDKGNRNYEIKGRRTGNHIYQFTVENTYDPRQQESIVWIEENYQEKCLVEDDKLFIQVGSDLPLGAIVDEQQTTFRLFSPRADSVKLVYFQDLKTTKPEAFELDFTGNGIWEGRVDMNLHGWYYYYNLDGDSFGGRSHFDETFKVVDPYALAVVAREGPGVVIDPQKVSSVDIKSFKAPAVHDLVVLEAHVRDLIAKAPISLKDDQRLGFSGLSKWIKTEGSYLRELGINAVELQPVQENDAKSVDEYHWGYMPINYFAPASQYGLNPQEASQIQEFRELVNVMHEAGLAVILDVVYNHVGEPNHLMFIAREYYFELSPGNHLMNFSGCGNDFKAHACMAKRLIIDSLKHWIEFYGVDGFRFDLAELLGFDVLKEIETELRKVKKDIILIAEPWSFRGHLGFAMRQTSYSSWNDGYREFMTKYLLGEGNREGFEYFIKGSIDYLSEYPWQSVNYVESHDDYCWLDRITENNNHDASEPTLKDRRRMHLMVAVLMSSVGLPMLAQGQDILRSKKGIHNTYQRGDINAVEYGDLANHAGTHEYFKRWIKFRLSEWGELIRLTARPSGDYFKFFYADEASAMAVLYNADMSKGQRQLLFAINPHDWPLSVNAQGLVKTDYLQIGDHERLQPQGLTGAQLKWEEPYIAMPPLSCGLWISAEK